MKISYNGLNYHGWQSQPNEDLTIQNVIEKKLSILLNDKTAITGSGRTDAGVHALETFAHFDTDKIIDKEKFLHSLNSLIGRDIYVSDVIKVSETAHARFDAIERTYRYFISYDKSPFYKDFSLYMNKELDIDLMNESTEILKSATDFTSFAKLHSDVKTNICHIFNAQWHNLSHLDSEFYGPPLKGICFSISADRFLRNMVRAIVGTLIEIGKGKISLNDLTKIIESKNRCDAGVSVPPQGLFLWNVKYPYL